MLRLEAEPGEAGQPPALGTGRIWGKEEEPEKRGKVFRKLILILVDKVGILVITLHTNLEK